MRHRQTRLLKDFSLGFFLESLLLDPSPNSALRVQRLVGIILKRPFAIQGPAVPYSLTGAQRSWPWASNSPEQYTMSLRRRSRFSISFAHRDHGMKVNP
jgi:hypothetical protein